jgi:hypothetical protein
MGMNTRPIAVLLGAVMLAGCHFDGNNADQAIAGPVGSAAANAASCAVQNAVIAPNGDLGKVSFFYSTGPVCSHGCTFAPLMLGTDETVAVQSCSVDLPNDLTATSANPETVSVDVVPADLEVDGGAKPSVGLHVRALAKGTASIKIARRDGTVLDSVTFTVAEPAKILLTSHSEERGAFVPDSLSVAVSGQRANLSALARDASGANLQGTNGWTFTVNPSIANVTPWCTSACADEVDLTLGGANMAVVGVTAGSASITIKTGSVSQSLPLTVTP